MYVVRLQQHPVSQLLSASHNPKFKLSVNSSSSKGLPRKETLACSTPFISLHLRQGTWSKFMTTLGSTISDAKTLGSHATIVTASCDAKTSFTSICLEVYLHQQPEMLRPSAVVRLKYLPSLRLRLGPPVSAKCGRTAPPAFKPLFRIPAPQPTKGQPAHHTGTAPTEQESQDVKPRVQCQREAAMRKAFC